MQIFIIGYMYCGKSTIGKKLARALGYDFVDTDDLFEERYHISIPQFFEKYSEKLFRELERDVLLSTFNLKQTVISTGGGTACSTENINYIKQNGISVFLESDIDTIMSRLRFSQKERPVLNRIPEKELQTFIQNQLAERTIFYQQADIIFPAKNVNIESLKEIIWNKRGETNHNDF